MYSYEQKVTAVKLLKQYDMSYSTVVRELGYPDCTKTLKRWYQAYKENHNRVKKNPYVGRKPKYTEQQKKAVVKYYLEHGKCINRTCKKLGYPSRPLLEQWIDELAPTE